MVKVIGAATVLVDRMGDAPMCRSAPTGHWLAVQGARAPAALARGCPWQMVQEPKADPCVEHRRGATI